MEIIPAQITDSIVLTELTKASKKFWGYSEEQMKLWDTSLTVTENYIAENNVMKALVDHKIAGYFSIIIQDGNKAKLDNLFIDPSFIGKGIGTALLNAALLECRKLHYTELWVEADPNAEGFYLKNDFKTTGRKESAIPGRYLPIMRRILP